MHALAAALVLAAAPLPVWVLPQPEGQLPAAQEARVKLGTPVTLRAVAKTGDGLVADAPEVLLPGGRRAKARPHDPAKDGALRVRWTKLEVAAPSLSNTDPSFHWEEIPYRETPIAACDDRLSCPADVRATLLGDRGGLGTMAFRAEVSLGDRRGASPGLEQRYRGGLVADVARVTVRRDDSYLGRLTELFNTPYIWGSEGIPAKTHQAERRIGSDCADFVTYGVRQLGHDVPYTSTYGLPDHARTLASSEGPGADGVYRDGKGRPIAWGQGGLRPGDLLLFPRHVGALVRDEAPVGVLSTSDVMIHTSWAEPAEQPLAESGWGSQPLRVLRFKALDR